MFRIFKSDDIVKSNEKISFRDQLNKIVDNQELVLEIENKIKEKAGSVLKLNPSKIEIKTPFKTMGIDSLMSIQLKNQLEKAFEMPISVTSFWTYPNIKEFTKFILCELAIGKNQLIEEEITINSLKNGN
ncbi:MAG: acyl carrier protein [Bacteroidetes bacterium]|nr:acyl carrier protein [Bacteroidota bacterium]